MTLGAGRRAAWVPILSRVAAGALALIGLAAIGVAARRSPELTSLVPEPSVALGQLSGSVASGAPAAPEAGSEVREPLPEPPRPEPAALEPARGPAPVRPAEQRPCVPAAAPLPVPAAALEVSAGSPPSSSAKRAAEAPALVDLNSADARQLRRLPGVGAKRAQAIIELRERLGGFRAVSDLLRIRGIGRRMLERMAPEIVVGPRGEAPRSAPQQTALTDPGREQPIPPRPSAH